MSFYALMRTIQHAAVWAGTPPAPPPSSGSFLLLRDGSSYLLLRDGVSKLNLGY